MTLEFYAKWKQTYLVPAAEPGQLFVLDDEENRKGEQASTSEGHGYGMLIVAFLAGADPQARQCFDGLYRFARTHASKINPRLMGWRQEDAGGGRASGGEDAATDGDLDIAMALLLADAQWGSSGPVVYREEASQVIAAIKQDEINHETWSVKLGDWSDPEDKLYFATRPSDFMLDHFRSFAAATEDPNWAAVLETCQRLVATMQSGFSPQTGLVPDFIAGVNDSPAPPLGKLLEGKHDGHYYYNSCRVPFRLGVDYLINGDVRTKAALDKLTLWVKTATGGDPANMRDISWMASLSTNPTARSPSPHRSDPAR